MSRTIERRLAALADPTDSGPDTDALRAALADRAEREGLLDVAYAPFDSPVGELTVFTTRIGLAMLAYPEEELDAAMARLVARISPRILAAPRRTDAVRRELDAYFAGDLHRFSTPVDWRLVEGFTARVLHATAEIPYGSVSTYRHVAEEAGSSTRFRSWCPATACCRPAAGSAATGAGSSERSSCCDSRVPADGNFVPRTVGDGARDQALRLASR
jgi:methylated-DNA-[protein]-cysteine S-methyltransferase